MAGAYSKVAGVKSGLCANFQGAQVPCAHANKYNGVSAASAYASAAAVPYVHQEIPAVPYVHDPQGDVDMAGAYSKVAGVNSGLCANSQGAQVPCAHSSKYNGVSAASAYASAAAVPYVHQVIPAVPYVHDPQGDVDMASAYSNVPTYSSLASASPAAVPYVHQEIPAMPYVHDSQGDVDIGGAYSNVVGINSGLCVNVQGVQVPCAN